MCRMDTLYQLQLVYKRLEVFLLHQIPQHSIPHNPAHVFVYLAAPTRLDMNSYMIKDLVTGHTVT